MGILSQLRRLPGGLDYLRLADKPGMSSFGTLTRFSFLIRLDLAKSELWTISILARHIFRHAEPIGMYDE